MVNVRSLAFSVVCLALAAASSQAQDLSRYREFELGTTLAAVAQQARLTPSAARLLHTRPQLVQQLDWLPQLRPQARPAESEAVRMVRFTFYDGRLYRIEVQYDRDRVEGLVAADFVQAISTSYGLPILASTNIGAAPSEEPGLGNDRTVAAQWEDPQYSVTLVRTRYPSAFELLLVARQADRLAQAAILASTRLDLEEAPQADIDRRAKQAQEDRKKADKARDANKPVFRF